MNGQNIVKIFGKSFPNVWHNATKFGFNQVLMTITLPSISGISRICKTAAFNVDGLVKALLKLDKSINKNAISAKLKNLGQSGAPRLQILLLSKNARWLHELYKQCSTSETWIEQVKEHIMAESTLTNDFWANDILWQLSVFAYNISIMMCQKKDKFKQQEHRNFIDWFIAVPGKITKSGHQTESEIANPYKNKQFGEQIKMYEHHFYNDRWQELDWLIEAA